MMKRLAIALIGFLCLIQANLTMSLPSSFLGRSLRLRFTVRRGGHGPCSSKSASRYHRRSIATRSRITMMPEGPEVRTLVDQLQGGVGRRLLDIQFVSGRYVTNGKPDGFPEFSATMTPLEEPRGEQGGASTGKVDMIKSWQAKGKFIYIILDDGHMQSIDPGQADDFQRSIWITLGMTGKFVSEKVHAANGSHCRWFLEVLDTAKQQRNRLHYHDMRNFGTMKLCLSKDLLEKKLLQLGPDILEPGSTTVEVFLEVAETKNPDMNVCKFLMNQKYISGVGNYILADGLYRARIDPFASLKEITEPQRRRLFQELQSIALESYAAQGMTRQQGGVYRNVNGTKGNFEIQLQCYGRQVCPKGNLIIKDTKGPHGRTIWYTQEQLFMPLHERNRIMAKIESIKKPAKTASTRGTSPGRPVETQQNNGWNIWESPPDGNSNKAETLLSSLVEPGWRKLVSEKLQDDKKFRDLAEFLQQETSNGEIVYPPHNDLFSALNLCPLEKVKVVIVGQDPYHGPGQGHGLAFSVKQGVPSPPSLKNIFKEAMDDVDIDSPPHGNLEHWAEQGVLMLNSVLTVRQGDANSHARKGWEHFTDFIIQYLNSEKKGLVFLLFGNPAQKKASKVDETEHMLIRTSHPSPLGARKTAAPFLGSRCFSQCNQALKDQGRDPIDWSVR